MRIADPALLGDIELAPQPPVIGLQKIRTGVLGRNRDGTTIRLGTIIRFGAPSDLEPRNTKYTKEIRRLRLFNMFGFFYLCLFSFVCFVCFVV